MEGQEVALLARRWNLKEYDYNESFGSKYRNGDIFKHYADEWGRRDMYTSLKLENVVENRI